MGIWSGQPGNVALLARSGDPRTSTSPGVNYTSPFGFPSINSAGQTAFYATVTGTQGLWLGTPGNVALLALVGFPAPDTTSGVTYSLLLGPTLNAIGQSAFRARITGTE